MLARHHIGGCVLPAHKPGASCVGLQPFCRRAQPANGVTSCSRSVRSLRASGNEEAPSSSRHAPDAGLRSGPVPASAEVVEGPWSPEFIREIVRQQEQEDEQEYGEVLTQDVLEDPEDLYYYLDRAYDEGPRHVTTPMALMLEDQSGFPTFGFPAAVANDIVGMGSWRIREELDPIIQFLVPRIEGTWRELLDTDLNLYPKELWKARGWDLVDSEDPLRELDGFSYADIPDPEKGTPGFPRLKLENRVYCSKVFRKLHLEVGVQQDGLQVLHVVVYPRYSYDLPIFGLDLVMRGDRVTLAVADCCPVRKDLKLPAYYKQTMAELQKTFLGGLDPTSRRIPDWGAASFSPLAVCITPSGPEELAAFVKYAVALNRAHVAISLNAMPVLAGPGDVQQAAKLQEIAAGQKRFCDNQLVNIQTRRVLDKAFGTEFTEAYMGQLMFDCDPTYEPPFYDASYERLYRYFDEDPGFGAMADESYRMELAAEGQRAVETVQKVAVGEDVPEEKLKMAMDFLYQNDPKFRAAIRTLSNREVEPGEFLSEELLKGLRGST